ncbi:UNVERIFIED_CONTAM: ThiF family protein [Hammondia hammondi]|eukprot:XP_008881698.1 ThiF family protein [Hammondia hammondi]
MTATSSPFSSTLFLSGVFFGTLLGAHLARYRLNHPSSASSLSPSSSSSRSPSSSVSLQGVLSILWGFTWGELAAPGSSATRASEHHGNAAEEAERATRGRRGAGPNKLPVSLPSARASPREPARGLSASDEASSISEGDSNGDTGGDSWMDLASERGEEEESEHQEREAERRQRDGLVRDCLKSPRGETVELSPSPCLVLEVSSESDESRRACHPSRPPGFLSDFARLLSTAVRGLHRTLPGALAGSSYLDAETPVATEESEETLFPVSLRLPDAWWGETASYAQRFSRQVLLPSWGLAAQRRLRTSSVLIVGCGGLGCPAALYLCAGGIGRLGLVDGDDVEVSNLQRQVAHTEGRAGWKKVHSLRHSCRAVNSQVAIETYPFHVSWGNALNLVRRFDVIVDATDNQPTRFLLNDACVLAGKPLVCGSALRWEGQLCVYNLGLSRGSTDSPASSSSLRSPCYRCLHPVPSGDAEAGACDVHGVIGPAPGVVGILQALETLKICGGLTCGEASARLLTFDGLDVDRPFRTFRLRRKREDCQSCGTGLQRITTITPRPEYSVVCPFPVLSEHQKLSSTLFMLMFSLHLVLHRQLSCLLTGSVVAGLLLHARLRHSRGSHEGDARDAGETDEVKGQGQGERVDAQAGCLVLRSGSQKHHEFSSFFPSFPTLSCPQTAAAKAAFRAVVLAAAVGARGRRDETEAIRFSGKEVKRGETGAKTPVSMRGESKDAPEPDASYLLLPIDVRPCVHTEVGQLPFSLHLPLPQLQKEVENIRKLVGEQTEEEGDGETGGLVESAWEDGGPEAEEPRPNAQRLARREEWTRAKADERNERGSRTQKERQANPCTHDAVHMTLLQRFILQQLHLSLSDFRGRNKPAPLSHIICVLICRRGNDSAIATKVLASLNDETCTVKLRRKGRQKQEETLGGKIKAFEDTHPDAEGSSGVADKAEGKVCVGALPTVHREKEGESCKGGRRSVCADSRIEEATGKQQGNRRGQTGTGKEGRNKSGENGAKEDTERWDEEIQKLKDLSAERTGGNRGQGRTGPRTKLEKFTRIRIPEVSVFNLTGGLLQLQRQGFLSMPIV